ncbi:MAG: hypothetical protein QOK07_2132, partial [Gemmatimonadaceae bacterium]|nr:hypothetical protein [Gemmatimonadaceae bacterium]
QAIATAAKPWASLYSDSTAISSAVTFFHLGGLLFAGGLAISTDRATFRALRGTDDDRNRLLADLGNSHSWVLAGLSVIFISGLLLALSDVKTFGYSLVYWTKMSLVVLLLLNGLLLQRTERKLRAGSLLIQSTIPRQRLWSRLRFAAATSMVLWTAIVLAGVILVESA